MIAFDRSLPPNIFAGATAVVGSTLLPLCSKALADLGVRSARFRSTARNEQEVKEWRKDRKAATTRSGILAHTRP